MTDGQKFSPLSDDELAEQYFDNLHTAQRSLQEAFALRASQGMTQDDLASRLNADKGLISKRLNGQENMTLKTMSIMASGLNCGLRIQYVPYEEYESPDNYFESRDEDLKRMPRASSPTGKYEGLQASQ